MSGRRRTVRVATRVTRAAAALVASLLVSLGCDAESTTQQPGGDDMVLSPGNNLSDGGMVISSGTDSSPDSGAPLPPGQRYQVGGGLGVGTVAGGVLMTSERYQLFGATGQSPANQIKSTTERFYLRSGVVGVTP